MALFRIAKGSSDALSEQKAKEGNAWFTQDDGKFYIDIRGNGEEEDEPIVKNRLDITIEEDADGAANRIPLNAEYADKLKMEEGRNYGYDFPSDEDSEDGQLFFHIEPDYSNAIQVYVSNSSKKAYVLGVEDEDCTDDNEGVDYFGIVKNESVYTSGSVLYNAAWNDYAERRKGIANPGQCVCEVGDGFLELSTRRLQPGGEIVSDTFGMLIGDEINCNLPIAVSGRVLAYTYRDRENYKAGDAVCAAPNGTVDIMTREEIKEYPDRIIGTVSEIPDYEYWGIENVKVNNRIWIRIR